MRRLKISIANATFHYGFEYLGVGDQLVQTPLTDRCYLTLTQALHLQLGGNPFGPVGTGKTESVKQLGAQLGRFVLVFNCDDTFDFQAMGRIFRGLCQVDAWGCFDKFNRLEEHILSAMSQQILAIQTGLLRGSKEIELIGKPSILHDDVGIFVTMNPGYAGRSNLPDNLKQLFRSIAMIKPDWELIAQVMLFSQGFRSAESLAGKIVLLFSLCDDQLSAQPHYDFGLRALKSVLVSAGSLKRLKTKADAKAAADKAGAEAEVAVETAAAETGEGEGEGGAGSLGIARRADRVGGGDGGAQAGGVGHPLFNSILSGVFPHATSETFHDQALIEQIKAVCAERHYVTSDKWMAKVLQLQQIQRICHGVMMVSPTGSGKSSACEVLLTAMERVDGVKGKAYYIDPKAITKDELYGTLDNTTLEWTDSVFTHLLRQVLNNVRGEAQRRHWIVFDGDVDPEWAENLNSVLDANKLLTLPNVERLVIPNNVRIMFEVEHLKYATLATVSRCGMIWFSADTVGADTMLQHYLLLLENEPLLGQSPVCMATGGRMEARQGALQRSAPPCWPRCSRRGGLATKALEKALLLPHCMVATQGRLLTGWWAFLGRGIGIAADYNERHTDFPLGQEQLKSFLEKWALLALIWGFGGFMNHQNRLLLSAHICQLTTMTLPEGLSTSAAAAVQPPPLRAARRRASRCWTSTCRSTGRKSSGSAGPSWSRRCGSRRSRC